MANLVVLKEPIAVFPSFVADAAETLIIKEKVMSLSGDSFDIATPDGRAFLKVQGKHMTLSGRKSFFDMQGNHLFDLCKEHFKLHATYVASTPEGKEFLTIKNSMSLFGSKANITLNLPNGTSHQFTMRGNWMDTTASIVLGDAKDGPVVGIIDRNLMNKRQILGGQQTYALLVAPGMDIAVMIALCVALDEKNNEK